MPSYHQSLRLEHNVASSLSFSTAHVRLNARISKLKPNALMLMSTVPFDLLFKLTIHSALCHVPGSWQQTLLEAQAPHSPPQPARPCSQTHPETVQLGGLPQENWSTRCWWGCRGLHVAIAIASASLQSETPNECAAWCAAVREVEHAVLVGMQGPAHSSKSSLAVLDPHW